MKQKNIIYPVVKRGLDIFGAVILLILSSPVMLITAILVRINLGKPVIFSQPRPGLNEKIFMLHKFRSMKNADATKGLITDEQRLTKFGKVLRSTSLDELPSLLNVLKGEMSFVGPRPLLVQYLSLYTQEQNKRHSVRPGITGLAQAKGRNGLSWSEKFYFDLIYVNSYSLKLDLYIIVLTGIVVLRRKNINAVDSATAQEFTQELES